MKASRELDARVALHVAHLERVTRGADLKDWVGVPGYTYPPRPHEWYAIQPYIQELLPGIAKHGNYMLPIPHYSESMMFAWPIAEQLMLSVVADTDADGIFLDAWLAGKFEGYLDGELGIIDGYLGGEYEWPRHMAREATPALAICVAALRLAGVKLPEETTEKPEPTL